MDERSDERADAIKRLKVKRDFRMHLGTYFIINVLMVAIWAMGPRVGFWPAWVMIGWGIGVALHGWWAYLGGSISEREIQRELGNRS